jgi:hypothetical protein
MAVLYRCGKASPQWVLCDCDHERKYMKKLAQVLPEASQIHTKFIFPLLRHS